MEENEKETPNTPENPKDTQKKAKMGRPEKLTPELQEKLIQVIRTGAYIETAVQFIGLSKETFYAWIKKGAKAKGGKYKDFSDSIRKAMAETEVLDLIRLEKMSKEDAKIIMWRLERKFPSRWGRKQIIKLFEDDKGAEFTPENINSVLATAFDTETKKDDDDRWEE
jgi:hypothetical protein